MHLTAEQDGIYRRLIDHYMETRQPLPDNDVSLARIAGVSTDAWAMAAAIVRPFFVPSTNQMLCHQTCEQILAEQNATREKQATKGRRGAQKRWLQSAETSTQNSSGHPSAKAQAMPSDSRTEENRREQSSFAASAFQKVYEHGIGIFPQLAPKSTSAIHQWLDHGCDVDRDILPELDRCKGRQVGSWGYFTNQITQAKATREGALPVIEGKPGDQNITQPPPITPEQRRQTLQWKKDRGMYLCGDEEKEIEQLSNEAGST
jgi:uncharacterized protein YdaU (DUF1376 family)